MLRILASTLVLLLVATAAQAHVSVRPRESKGATERYTVRVPTEGKVATTSVEIEVPPGVTINSVDPAEGATSDTKREADRVVAITWTVTINPGENRELVFEARNPTDASEIVWKAHQHFADGTISDWVGEAGTRRPAPVTKLTAATAGGAR